VLRLVLALLMAPVAAWAGATPSPSCALVPGWTQAGPARTFTVDNLYEYMDGNSEGYFLYNFQEMRGVTCKHGDITFVVDISDMADPDFAYGMFTATRDLRQPSHPVGAGGQIVPRRLIFAKGQYYVEIAANPEGDHTAALKQFAAALEEVVPGTTTPPAAFDWFPKERQQSLRLVPESVLGLRILRRGYLAQYEFGRAWVVRDEAATEVMQKLRARFGETAPVQIGDEAFQATDKYLGRLCVFRKGVYVGGYAVTDATDPVPLARNLAAKLTEPRP
jgi:hypothetical protein